MSSTVISVHLVESVQYRLPLHCLGNETDNQDGTQEAVMVEPTGTGIWGLGA